MEAALWSHRPGDAGLILVSLFAVRYQRAVFSQPKFNVKSIAVLPLRNLSGDASQEYLQR